MKREAVEKITRRIFAEKVIYHKAKAKLPIEEKVKILVKLQQIGIDANPNLIDKKAWKI